MEEDSKLLCIYLDAICTDPTLDIERPELKNEIAQEVSDKIQQLHTYLKEVYHVSTQLADGDLQMKIHKDNLYAGALKDLQSSLKHLIWQVGRVAEGDYNIRVDFLGDFTDSFHKMITQLKEREGTLKENAQLMELLSRKQLQLLENELDRKTEKYDQFAKSMAEIKSYRHDMQNHLLCIDSLLQEKDCEGAQRYIHSLTDIFASMDRSEKSENYILDALLNDKIEKAKELGVQIDKKVQIERKLNIENKDWCILMGNALDNSLEALQKVDVDKRELHIRLLQSGDMLSVQITNTFADDIQIDKNHIETTKEDRLNHGIGLKNIEQTVAKYDGEMSIKVEDFRFTLIFLLSCI